MLQVIYALNTKNDEHEAAVAAIREQHEQQVQQILAQTQAKLQLYRDKLSSHLNSQQQVQELQAALQQQQTDRDQALSDLQAYKQQMQQQALEMKNRHSEKLLAFSQQVLQTKKEFEEKSKQIDDLKTKYEADKLNVLRAMKEEHQREMEKLLSSQSSQQSNLETVLRDRETQYKAEIEKLQLQCETLQSDKHKLSEEHDFKMQKAQAFYEQELAALKCSQNAGFSEQLDFLNMQIDKLKKDLQFQESQAKKREYDLLQQLSLSEEEADKYKSELSKLQTAISSQDSSAKLLNQQVFITILYNVYMTAKAYIWYFYLVTVLQLVKLEEEMSELNKKYRGVQAEVSASQQRGDQQAQQLLLKSSKYHPVPSHALIKGLSYLKYLEEVTLYTYFLQLRWANWKLAKCSWKPQWPTCRHS